MIAVPRHERIAAARAWDRSFGRELATASANALRSVVSAISGPTVGDLLAFVGEQRYELDNPARVDVRLGDLVARPGEGPTVAAFVEALSEFEAEDLALVLDRQISAFVR